MGAATSHAPVSEALVSYLRGRGTELTFEDGEKVLSRGEAGQALYAVLSGSVEVRLESGDGQCLVLRRLDEGALFGEMSVLTGEPVSADVVAAGAATLLSYPGDLLPLAMTECAPLRERITASLAANLRQSSAEVWSFYQRSRALNVLLGPVPEAGPLAAESKPMKRVAEELRTRARTADPVLVTGAAGTGKTYAATRIAQGGETAGAPLLVLDCRKLTGEDASRFLLGSALTGMGAADAAEPSADLPSYGALHVADGGAVILQHVDALSRDSQRQLLRYLEALGEEESRHPRCRILATTRRDLGALAREDRFEPGLASVLESSAVRLPTLRERRKDILPLARLFLQEAGAPPEVKLSEGADHVLLSRRYAYRNAAELREALGLAVLFAAGGEIRAEHIFTGPKEEGDPREADLTDFAAIRRVTGGSVLPVVRGGVFAIFASIIGLCLAAPEGVGGRFANALVWGAWWPALLVVYLFAGRLWCTVCPLSTAGRLAARLGRPDRAPPAWLKARSPWLAPLGFLLIVWAEHTFHTVERPVATGVLLLTLMGAAATFSVLFRRETWCRYLCPMGSLGAVFSLPATLGVHSNPDVCGTVCTTHECHNGSATRPGCPVFHHPLFARDSHHCKLCFNCLASCPHGSARLYLRPPLLKVWAQADLSGALSLFALVVFFAAPLMLASQRAPWAADVRGFSVALAVAAGLAVALWKYFPRVFWRDPGEDPAGSFRLAFAMLVLAWGPAMAFQLGNSPALSTLWLQGEPGSVWAAFLPSGRLSALTAAQLGAVAFAALLAAVCFGNLKRRFAREGVSPSPLGWTVLAAICGAYLAGVGALLLV